MDIDKKLTLVAELQRELWVDRERALQTFVFGSGPRGAKESYSGSPGGPASQWQSAGPAKRMTLVGLGTIAEKEAAIFWAAAAETIRNTRKAEKPS